MVSSVKDSILLAGSALLRERGVGALTQPQIAQAAGVKQSHLTYYFPTRADLILAIAEHVVADTMAHIGASLPPEATARAPAEWARLMADTLLSGMPPRVIIGLIAAADAEPEIRAALVRLIAHVREHLTQMLARLGLPHDADTALLAHATVLGLAVMHQARLTPLSEQEVRSGLLALMHRLVVTQRLLPSLTTPDSQPNTPTEFPATLPSTATP